jgi:hypothetical protein
MPGIYRTNRLFFTHAWLPADRFDEVRERGGWIFARKGNGYLALYSQKGYRWQDKGDDAGRELIAMGKRNIWLCRMGRRAADGSFGSFMEKIEVSGLSFRRNRVRFESPGQGIVQFGWNCPLKLNGGTIGLGGYPRYDNPYARVEFPPGEIYISRGKHWLRLNEPHGVREASAEV